VPLVTEHYTRPCAAADKEESKAEATGDAHKETTGPPPAADGVRIILAYFRERYRPTFRRGNAIHCADGRDVPMAEATAIPDSDLIRRLESASDAPRFLGPGGGVKRHNLPGFFRTWAKVAWGDLLKALPEEDEADLEAIGDVRDEFRRLIREAMLTEVTLARTVKTGPKSIDPQFEHRSLIGRCQCFAKPGVWKSIRNKECFCKLVEVSGGELVLTVAIRHELFAQLRADRRLIGMGEKTLSIRAARYGVGRVVMGQRVNEQDLTGHLLARGGWEELRIPEECEPDRPCRTAIGWEDPRREAGELMRPERFGPAERDDAKATLGAVAYAAQHQQRPTPRGGTAFREEWWREWQPHGTGYNLAGRIIPDHDASHRFLTVDGAFTVKETSKHDPDFTVISSWVLAKGQLIALGSVWKRLQLPDIPAVVAKEYTRWRCQTVYAEGGGTQKGLPQLLRRHDQPALNVVEMVPGQQDKLARASDFLLMAEGGRVWWPAGGDYPRDAAKSQLLHFTGVGGGHDDYWDCCAMAGRVAKAKEAQGANAVPYMIRT
jgi:phage terminase large subunit-like protein